MIAAEAQAARRAIALDLLGMDDRCREILVWVPWSPNDGEITGDPPTELLTTIASWKTSSGLR